VEFKVGRTYRCVNGDEVKILAHDPSGTKLIGWHQGTPQDWTLAGAFFSNGVPSTLDLKAEKVEVAVFVNLFDDGSYAAFEDEAQADLHKIAANVKFVKRLKQTWEIEL
jgi:hypothetical protein